MTLSAVEEFNYVKGTPPVDISKSDDWWEQVQNQARLVLEEAQEQYDAALSKDLVELVDGACDIKYTQDYVRTILKHSGVDMDLAYEEVCKNNRGKYTTSKELAERSRDKYLKGFLVDCDIHSVDVDNVTYYVVKRHWDGKVMKLEGHHSPDIKKAIPEQLVEALKP